MIRKLIAAAMVFAAVLLCACSNQKPEPTPTPSPTPDAFAALQSEIAAVADAEATEEQGALIITLHVSGADEAKAAEAFFDQAELILVNCLRDTAYEGISFTMSVDDADVGVLYVMVRDSGIVAMPPMAYDTGYAQALEDAFMDSGFAYGEEW